MFSPLQQHADYENVVEMPMTPTESGSPFKAFSPIADAVRYAIKDGTRQWRRNFESFTQMAGPSHGVPKEYQVASSPHRMSTTKSSERAMDDNEDEDDHESTSLTPAFERQSLSGSADNMSFEAGRSGLHYRESLFGSPRRSFTSGSVAETPSLRSNSPMPALSPASHRSRSAVDCSDSRLERHALGTPYRSPSRSLRSHYSLGKLSIVNRSRLGLSARNATADEELRRLDRLQEKLDVIEQASSRLAETIRNEVSEMRSSGLQESRREYTYTTNQTANRLHSTFSSPIKSTHSRLEYDRALYSSTPLNSGAHHPALSSTPPPPTASPARRSAHPVSESPSIKRPVPVEQGQLVADKYSSPRRTETPTRLLRNVLSDIPSVKLRSAATYRSPRGTKVKNKVWEEIQAAKAQKTAHGQSPHSSPVVKQPVKRTPMNENQEHFWNTEGDYCSPRPGGLTERLMRVAQEEAEEREAQLNTPGSLGEELERANSRSMLEELEKARAETETQMFSLDPVDEKAKEARRALMDELRTKKDTIQRIEGDEWVFQGKEYSVKEKK